MKKRWMIGVNFLLAMTIMVTPIFAQTGTSKVQTGNRITTIKSVVKNGSTYVGIRDLGAAADIEVSYFSNSHTAYLGLPGSEMEIKLRTGETFVNGIYVGKASVVTIDGFSYLPFRFVSENLGYEVKYENGIIKLLNAQEIGFITPESDKVYDPNGKVYEIILNSNNGQFIPQIKQPETKPVQSVPDKDGLTTADYYIEYLSHIQVIKASVFEMSGADYEVAWPVEYILQDKAYLENTVMPKLIGTEFEQLARKWEKSVNLAVLVFSNNGNNNGELLGSVAGIDKVLEEEIVRLGITEVTLRKIQDRLNKAMGW